MLFHKANIVLLFSLAKTFTLTKALNSLLIRIEHLLGFAFNIKKTHANPESLSVEPSSICNLHCPECTLGGNRLTRSKQLLNLETFTNALNPLSKWLINCQFYMQGEPTLNNNLCKMIKLAHNKKLFTNISTNGMLLTPDLCENLVRSGLNQIIISIDGTTQEVYEKYRVGGNLATVISGIANLVEARKKMNSYTPIITAQFIVFRHNEHQTKEFPKLARKWGADKIVFKSAQIENYQNAPNLLPTNKRFRRYKHSINGEFYINRHFPINCFRLRSTMVINSEGNASLCCYDKNTEFCLGNVNQHSALQIWHNKKTNAMRQKVWNNKTPLYICRNCNE